jgi:hypothetical protein
VKQRPKHTPRRAVVYCAVAQAICTCWSISLCEGNTQTIQLFEMICLLMWRKHADDPTFRDDLLLFMMTCFCLRWHVSRWSASVYDDLFLFKMTCLTT